MVEHPRKRGHKDEDRRDFEGDHRPVFAGKRLGAHAAKQQRLIGGERGFFEQGRQVAGETKYQRADGWLQQDGGQQKLERCGHAESLPGNGAGAATDEVGDGEKNAVT